jgi:hypothetical protein
MDGDGLRRAWCSACGLEYEDPAALAAMALDQRTGCRQCSACAITFGMEFHATVTPSSSLYGHKPPSGSGESIRVSRDGDDPRVSGADVEPDGALSDHIEGRASPKVASELRAAQILAEHLNELGASWGQVSAPAGPEEGVDAVATSEQQTLRVQVTTPERDAWSMLAKTPTLKRTDPDVDDAVDSIKEAIERKTLFADRGEIVLALDATDSTRYALETVVDAFRKLHGTWATGIGYAAIWLVGPVASLVHRVDQVSAS